MDYTHGTRDTADWFKKAKPEPTPKDLTTQLGVHIEEVAEMLQTVYSDDPAVNSYLQDGLITLVNLSTVLKETSNPLVILNRIEFLDSLCDQIVTAVGVANQAGMDIVNGLNEVNRSNFSKFDDYGNPLLDKDRKIMKGPNYSKPDLTPFV